MVTVLALRAAFGMREMRVMRMPMRGMMSVRSVRMVAGSCGGMPAARGNSN